MPTLMLAGAKGSQSRELACLFGCADTRMTEKSRFLPKASSGIPGLDEVMDGGLARNRLHLLEGSPGTGKTTIALHFLMAGAEAGEVGMYVSLAETEEELRDGAASHGWTLGP